MKSRTLDPRAAAAIEHQRACPGDWTGPILLRNLPAALPQNGQRRSWRDAVTVFLLCELIGVHRVAKGKDPFWRGSLYQVNRNDLAMQFACDPDEVSASLQWLKSLGLVEVVHKTRTDGVGKPCGTEVYVVPRMDRMRMLLDFFVEKGRAMSPSKLMDSDSLQGGPNSPTKPDEDTNNHASSPLQKGAYLNCVKQQQKLDAEGGVEASAQRRERTVDDDRRSLGIAGGGGAADQPDAQVPLAKSAPPARWCAPPPPKGISLSGDAEEDAWVEAACFGELWAQAAMRNGNVTTCKLTGHDLKSVFDFFKANPQTHSFYTTAIALNAWWADRNNKKPSGWDKLRHCRQSRDVQSFLRSCSAGKLESEVGQLGWTINAYKDLRQRFTQSELEYYGWGKIPILSVAADQLWENDPDTPDYYLDSNLPLPPEVAVAEELREKSQE